MSTHTTTTPPTRPQRRPWKKWLLIGVAAFLLVLLIVGIFLPTILSTGPGQRYIVQRLSDGINGTLQVQDLRLGWGGQTIDGLVVLDAQGNRVLAADRVALPNWTLMEIVRGSREYGIIRINGLDANVVQDEHGINVLEALASPERPGEPGVRTQEERGALADTSVRVEITGGNVTYASPGIEPVVLKSIDMTLDMLDPRQISVVGKTAIEHGQTAGRLDIDTRITDLADARGNIQPEAATIEGVANATSLPVALIDGMMQQEGRLVALLGPAFDGQLNASSQGGATRVALDGRTTNLTAQARVNVTDAAVTITAEDAASMRLTVTPEAWRALAARREADQRSELMQPFTAQARVQSLTLPRTAEGIDYSRVAINAGFDVGDIVLDGPEGVGRIAVRNASGSITSAALAQALTAQLSADAQQDQQSGRIRLNATIRDAVTPEGNVNMQGLTAQVDGQVQEFPLAAMDQLAGTDGLFVDVLGPTLVAQIQANIQPGADAATVSGPFSITARSETLNIAVEGQFTPEQITVATTAPATLLVRPALLERFNQPATPPPPGATGDAAPADEATRLVAPATVEFVLRQMVVPVRNGALDMSGLVLDATARTAAQLQGPADVGRIDLRDTQVNVTANGLGPQSQPLTATLASAVVYGQETGSIRANAAVTNLLDDQGAFAAAGARATYEAVLEAVPPALIDAFTGQPGVARAATGSPVAARAKGKVEPMQDADGRLITFDANVASDLLNGRAIGEMTPTLLTVGPESFLTARVQPALVERIAPDYGIAEPANIDLRITQFRMPLGESAAGGLTLDLTGKADCIVPAGDMGGARLEGVTFTARQPAADRPLNLNAEAQLISTDGRGTLRADATVTQPMDAARRRIEANVDATNLPVGLVDAVAQQEGRLVAILGPSLRELRLNIETAADGPTGFTAKATGDRLTADVGGTLVPGERVTLREGSELALVVTPAAYDAWANAPDPAAPPPVPGDVTTPPLRLAEPANVRIVVEQAEVGLSPQVEGDAPKPPLDLRRACFVGRLTSPMIAMQRGTQPPVRMRDLTASINAPNFADEIQINAEARIEDPGTESAGSIDSRTTVRGLRNTADGLSFKEAGFTTKTQAKNVPVDLVDAILEQDGQLVHLLDRSASLDINAQKEPGRPGQLDVDLDSGNARGSVRAAIDNDMVLSLREPMVATMRITPELSRAYLSALNPLLQDAESTEQPVTLHLEQLTLPLTDYDFANVLAAGRLDIGTVTARRTGLVGGLVPVLRSLGLNIQDREKFPAEFTTLQFNVRDSVITSNDLWLSTGDLKLGSKGRITTVTDPQPNGSPWRADLVLGISGDTLRRIPGLQDVIAANTVYELPVSGPLNALRPDYGQLALQIGKVRAEAEARKALGREAGGAAGVAIDILGDLARDRSRGRGNGTPVAGLTTQGWPNKPEPAPMPTTPSPDAAATPAPAEATPTPTPAPSQPTEAAPEQPPPAQVAPRETTPVDALGGILERVQREREERDRRRQQEREERRQQN